MESKIIINKNLLEASPFFPERPFINPDKQLVKYELPIDKNYREFQDKNNLFKNHLFTNTDFDIKI
jgi:hypothetical protein